MADCMLVFCGVCQAVPRQGLMSRWYCMAFYRYWRGGAGQHSEFVAPLFRSVSVQWRGVSDFDSLRYNDNYSILHDMQAPSSYVSALYLANGTIDFRYVAAQHSILLILVATCRNRFSISPVSEWEPLSA